MAIRAAEISDILRQQLEDYGKSLEVRETGTVLSTGDGIARIYGLERAAVGELLEFPNNIYGMVLNLDEDNVGAAGLLRRKRREESGAAAAAARPLGEPLGRVWCA